MNEISIYRGDDTTINITVTDSNGDAVDITGYTFWFTVKKNVYDTDANALIQKVITSHTTPASGQSQITLTNSDTDLSVGSYFYDIQMKDTNDKITTLVKDTFTIKRDITTSDE